MTKVFAELFPKGTQGTLTPGYYMNEHLRSNLQLCKDQIQKDWDMIFLVDGVEGGGKSTIAMQMAFFCDPQLKIQNVCFGADDFRKAVLGADKYTAIVYDEAYRGMSAKGTMEKVNKGLVSMLTEIRQKNLFIFIVLPTYFDLVKYAAIWRTRALIHITASNFQRGFFQFFSYEKKKEMFVKGRKFYSYRVVRPNFVGRFTNFYPLDKEEYRKRKRESLKNYEDQEKVKKAALEPRQIRAEVLKKVVAMIYARGKEEKMTIKKIAWYLNMSTKQVSSYLKDYKLLDDLGGRLEMAPIDINQY